VPHHRLSDWADDLARYDTDMDFEQFKEFMLQSAAQHDARITAIEESMGRLISTVDRLVDNQVFLQEKSEELKDEQLKTERMIQELSKIVFRHVVDPQAHGVTPQ
jgi:hypothetical protein